MTSIEQASRKSDAIADRYEEMFFYVADLGARLIDVADPAPGSRVLDIGADRGAVARAALARNCVVTAIDASPRMIARLSADHPAVSAHVMDAARLGSAPPALIWSPPASSSRSCPISPAHSPRCTAS